GTGALGGVASGQVQDARQRDHLLPAVEAEVQLAAMRLQLAQAQFETVRDRFDVGAATRATLAEAEAELVRMRAALQRSRLNLEEVRASAAPPRDDVAAPLVGERDFAGERLNLRLLAAQRRLATVEAAVAEL